MDGSIWLTIVTVLFGAGGIVGGLTAWGTNRKLTAEASKVEVDAAIAVDSAEDKHLLTIIENQAQHLVTPLREEVSRLRIEVQDLRKALQDQTASYWRLVTWARDMIIWSRMWHAGEESKPPHPSPPEEVEAYFR